MKDKMKLVEFNNFGIENEYLDITFSDGFAQVVFSKSSSGFVVSKAENVEIDELEKLIVMINTRKIRIDLEEYL